MRVFIRVHLQKQPFRTLVCQDGKWQDGKWQDGKWQDGKCLF